MSERGYSKSFINKCVQHIRSALLKADELCGADTHSTLYKPIRLLHTNPLKERFLDAAEAGRLRDYVELHHRDAVCLLIGFLMYTGARRHEVFAAEWQHINLERNSWYVPVTKNGKPRYVMLNRRAVQRSTAANTAVHPQTTVAVHQSAHTQTLSLCVQQMEPYSRRVRFA
jgi:integrase